MTSQIAANLKTEIKNIDDELSKRPIDLDPKGYFIIYLDREAKLIYAKHFTNIINDKGLAADPDTGEVIACGSKSKPRVAETIFSARTAKELCVKVIEEPNPPLISMFDHACYLGREFNRAEYALIDGTEYIQD